MLHSLICISIQYKSLRSLSHLKIMPCLPQKISFFLPSAIVTKKCTFHHLIINLLTVIVCSSLLILKLLVVEIKRDYIVERCKKKKNSFIIEMNKLLFLMTLRNENLTQLPELALLSLSISELQIYT